GLLGLVVTTSTTNGPSLILYSDSGHVGATHNVTEFDHDLSLSGFDNIAKSFCAEGVWILYDAPDYNMHHDPFFSWSYVSVNSQWGCHELPVTHHDKVSSVRFAGTGDMQDESVTLYHGFNFMGGEILIIRSRDELGEFKPETSSMIITGQSSWTAYSEEFYGGFGICMEPWNVGNGIYVGVFEVDDIGVPNNDISSVRKGCFAEKHVTRIHK
ncbi:unnamed protein product, partial [Meganyctiphanes norvegica]